MTDFIIIPIIAVSCYAFLLLAFLAAKRNTVIDSFIRVLIFSILWTGGSLFMRIHFFNLDKIWYDLSIWGLLLLSFELLVFIKSFAGIKIHTYDKILGGICALTALINTFTGFFLAMPDAVLNDMGQEIFVYDIGWPVIVLFVLLSFMVGYILKIMLRNFKKDEYKEEAVKPIKIGLVILFVGHVLTIVPVLSGFPFDILSSIIFVLTLFYSLYKKRMFRLDLLFSKWIIYLASVIVTVVILYNSFELVYGLMSDYFIHVENQILYVSAMFTFITFGIYRLMERFIDSIYVSNETMRNETLKKFKNSIFSALEVDEISKLIINHIKDSLNVKEVYVMLPDKENKCFRVNNTSNPLNRIDFRLASHTPLLEVLKNRNECIFSDEFKKLNAYKSLWIDEKKELMYLNIECFVPLIDDDELIGLLMITEKNRKSKFTYDDILFLDGMGMVSSTALRKAQLYEKVYNEARLDDLTKLLNRKYFLSTLNELYEKKSNDMVSISIINIDDFKLYNQLYGNAEGDKVLVAIARILNATMEGIGFCSRYDSKVFACVFPRYDTNQTKFITEKIVKQISEINSDSNEYKLKMIRVSCGISTIPFLANNVKDLINDAELAVYYVKRNGKNGIRISTGQIVKRNENPVEIKHKSGIFSEYAATINALTATIDTKDHYTFSHSKNVAYYATELGYGLNMDEDSIEIIREAALLHDIGKIGIDENILNKSGKLDYQERLTMQGHVENSVSIIRHLPSLTYVIPAVIGHHERWDGNGYPRRVKGDDIPLFARILCIADSFDAMLSKRSYKETRSVEYALEELHRGSGTQFDPDLVVIFVEQVKNKKILPIVNT